MKRTVAMLLIAALLIPLAACGGGSVEENKLVVWHDKEDAVIEALTAYLTEAAPGIEVVFEKKTSLTDSLKLVGNDPSSAPDMFIFDRRFCRDGHTRGREHAAERGRAGQLAAHDA